MRYFLLAILLFTGCAQGKKIVPPQYTVVTDIYIGVLLKHSALYVMSDLNGDDKVEIAVVDEPEENIYTINLYIRNGDKWYLTNSVPMTDLSEGQPVKFATYHETNLVLPVSIPDDNQLVALDVDGIPGKEVLVPYNGTTRNAILVYKVTNNTLLKIAEFKENIAELSGGVQKNP